MSLRSRFERAIGLGPSDEPRVIAVGTRAPVVARPLVSTPGARVRISHDGRDAELGGVLVACHRRGIPVELVEGPNLLLVDGHPVSPAQFRVMKV